MEAWRHRWPRWLLVVLLSVTSILAIDDSLCPRQCDCSYMMRDPAREQLEITCFVHHVDAFDYGSLMNVVEPYTLSVRCDSAVSSVLTNSMFSALHSCDDISFHQCKFSYVHRYVFDGLLTLRKVTIDQASRTQLELHPLVFQDITNVDSVSITESGVVKIPDLCGLQQLRHLNVSRNSLMDFKDSGLVCDRNKTLPSLKFLDISRNRVGLLSMLQHLGTEFPKLEGLWAAENAIEISDNDDPFASFGTLESLDLHGNRITRMPTVLIQNNPVLLDLDLSENDIQNIPKSFFSNSQRMLKLQLQGNALDDLVWERVGELKTLMYFDVSNNQLTKIDQRVVSDLVELVVLELAYNEITSVPRRVFQNQLRLEELSLAGNMLEHLDVEALYGLLSLSKLELQDNNLQTLDTDILSNVTALLHLNVSSNVLDSLPSLKRLPSLLTLDARNNILQALPEDIFIGQTNLRNLYVTNNQIAVLSEKLFLSCSKLAELDLSNNRIESVYPGIFRDLPVLKLFLNYNRIRTIGRTFSGMTKLRELRLKNNLISDTIQRYMFPTSLEILDLSMNNIEYIRNYAFDGLNKIRLVDLRYNSIQSLSDVSLAVSTGLYSQTGFLIDNNPLRCDCDLLWLKTWTQSAHGPVIENLNTTECSGAYNYPPAPVQSVPEDRFLCKYEEMCPLSCRCCDYTACDCKYKCPSGCECYRSQDYSSIHYVNCSAKNISQIDRYIPRLATQLDLSGNSLTEINSHSFIGMSNLTHLFLNNSNVQAVGNRSFHGLAKLKVLYLNNNSIRKLYKFMFSGLTSLSELYLDHNHITDIQIGTFEPVRSLSVLRLHDNHLQQVNEYINHLVYRIQDITMYNNPWICDCVLYVTANYRVYPFLKKKGILLNVKSVNCTVGALNKTTSLDSYGSVCEEGTSFENLVELEENSTSSSKNISNMNKGASEVVSTNLDKTFNDIRLKIFIPVMLASTLIFIVVLMVVCRKEFIRFWLFTKFQCKSRDRQILYDKTRFYDAFLSYSPRDELYVIRELALKLERGKPRYRLRVQHRDWESGCSIQGFIETSVRSSHRTILVISSEYLQESHWLNYVTQCVKQDSIRRLIMVVLGKIDTSKLDPVLRSYMRSDFCIRYGDSWFWEKLYYCLPEPKKSARETSPLAQPYASSDLGRFSSAMMDNQAYEEPLSIASRPLPTVDEYIPTSHSYDYAGGSGNDSNIYEEIKDLPTEQSPSAAYCKPWKQIYMEAQCAPERELLTQTKDV